MKLIEHAKEGLHNLLFSKLRSILALLGVLVGTASVVAMVLGGELATNEALRQFASLGTDLLAISISTGTNDARNHDGVSENLTWEDANSLQNADKNIINVAPYTQVFSPMSYEGNPIPGVVLGVTNNFADIVKIKLEKGRFVSLIDQYNFYCVIGHDIDAAIKKLTERDSIGQALQIGKNIFIIVGVASPWPENNFVYANIDTSVMVPILASTVITKYATISNIIMQLSSNADIENVKTNISNYFEKNLKDKQINYRSAKELINKMKNQSEILTVFLGLIGSVSLIVGGIGVMNIMLVSVIERRREIGIRLAVGAKRRDIGALFLMEAVMLSLLGGTLGVIIGFVIAYVIAWFWRWQFTLFLWPPLVGFTVSVAIGIFFGFYPALRAAKLNPIEALRTE